jgi:hypothetical protein
MDKYEVLCGSLLENIHIEDWEDGRVRSESGIYYI